MVEYFESPPRVRTLSVTLRPAMVDVLRVVVVVDHWQRD